MKTELLNSIQEWLKPIREQMDANQKAMLTSMIPGTTTNTVGGLGNIMLQKLAAPNNAGAALDPAQMQQDLQTRGLLTRIKYANISRGQRDSLSSTVRMLSVDGRLGEKSMRKLYEMITLMESIGGGREKKTGFSTGAKERTVDDEMDWIYEKRASDKAQEKRLGALQSAFSMYA
jgi:hypothetical protein